MNTALNLICLVVITYASFKKLHVQKGFAPMSDGTKLFYSISGKGNDTLVFLHGGPGQNSKGVGPDLAPLAKKHVLIIYDQRGCGLSEAGDTSKLSANAHVNDLEDLRKFFRISQMTLIGHSWGCMLATLYNSKYAGHVRRLLLLSPGPPTRKLFQQRFAAFAKKDSTGQARVARLRSQLETSNDPLSICREILEINERLYYADPKKMARKKGDYCAIPPEAISKQGVTARLTLKSLGDWNLVPLIETITQPALVVEGLQTPVPMEEFEIWAKALPNGKLLLVKNVGHAYPFVEQPNLFFPAVEEFLKGGWPPNSKIIK